MSRIDTTKVYVANRTGSAYKTEYQFRETDTDSIGQPMHSIEITYYKNNEAYERRLHNANPSQDGMSDYTARNLMGTYWDMALDPELGGKVRCKRAKNG